MFTLTRKSQVWFYYFQIYFIKLSLIFPVCIRHSCNNWWETFFIYSPFYSFIHLFNLKALFHLCEPCLVSVYDKWLISCPERKLLGHMLVGFIELYIAVFHFRLKFCYLLPPQAPCFFTFFLVQWMREAWELWGLPTTLEVVGKPVWIIFDVFYWDTAYVESVPNWGQEFLNIFLKCTWL